MLLAGKSSPGMESPLQHVGLIYAKFYKNKPLHSVWILVPKKETVRCMENNEEKKPGPKDRDYVNKSQPHEVKYEPKRKKPAKKFGSGDEENNDPGQRR
jgi:hypothetical protein